MSITSLTTQAGREYEYISLSDGVAGNEEDAVWVSANSGEHAVNFYLSLSEAQELLDDLGLIIEHVKKNLETQ